MSIRYSHRTPQRDEVIAINAPSLPQPDADGQKLWLVFAGLMLALVLAALDQNIVATALPRIVGDLGGLAHLSWVVTAFMVASTMTTPLYGKPSDIFGPAWCMDQQFERNDPNPIWGQTTRT
jgi:hypothetical protein